MTAASPLRVGTRPHRGLRASCAQHRSLQQAVAWLPSVLLVGLAHAGLWIGYAYWTPETTPPRPLPAVQVALFDRLPPANRVTALQKKISREERKTTHTQALPMPAASTERPATPNDPVASADHEEITQPVYTAAYLNNPPPAYPLAARRRGVEGTVLIRIQVGEDGNGHQASVKKSSGYGVLDQAALVAVKVWRFLPARRGAEAISAWIEVPITFRLNNPDEQARSL